MKRRPFLAAAAALSASVFIPSVRACEFFTNTLRVLHPWTRATLPGASLDTTAALVCMSFDQVAEADRLIGVHTPVAERVDLIVDGKAAPIDLPIPKGQETLLSEEGTHIRLTGLTQPLLIGRDYPLKLEFEKSGMVNARLNIDFLRSLTR